MNVTMQRRAEIAFDLLNEKDHKQLQRALERLNTLSPFDFYHDRNIHKLVFFTGEKLYSFKGNKDLRILLSIDNENTEKCIVEDIFTVGRLKKLPVFRDQQIV